MSKRSAVVVEDDHELGEIFTEILLSIGMHVDLVADGQQAMDWLDETVPEVVMLDMHLPRVSGVDILHRIRRELRLQNTSVVVITADALIANVVNELADFVLIKPVDIDQLTTLAERVAS